MDTERPCLYCGLTLSPEWARKDQKFCNRNCRASFWYYAKYKKHYDERYKQQKREWEQSPSGKRAGVALRVWRRLPKDWR